ncbi:hypothetical protein A2982_02530 [candidate division WWE3 bacterium RIFCSPLOWO2_01_FULL_39_13]|uniref:RCK N-terminal domain-containing protein n=1 Tax=candidate division WWE3 bacterium RIFCSPLOWO2_01_FULL_39_13 TaxID=1802624 RepID=A0A1F4V4E4_UNCKA|nr:MAG: hypothetical protein A2982_02530 [candidate division WWE3 bacterium RIFCSPLOWO2_01_FULL_39_13]
MPAFFLEITIALVLASFLGALASFFKQPLVFGYILAGLIIGPVFSTFSRQEIFASFAQVGIALLLFLVGLELKFRELAGFSKKIPLITFIQVLLTFLSVFAVAKYLNLSQTNAVLLALVTVFSSTALVVKLLSDKRDLDSLYGQVTVGILILQDLIAIAVLIVLSQLGNFTPTFIISSIILKGLTLIILVILLKEFLLASIFDKLAKNLEILFLGALAYAFMMAALANFLDFSPSAGAFLAGLSLANTREEYQIASRIRPLRDFFLVIFFVFLGTQISLSNLKVIFNQALVISLAIILVKLISVTLSMLYLGFRKRTALFTGLSLAQISEFSLVLILVLASFQLVEKETVSLVTLVSLITFAVSSYLVIFDRKIINYLSPLLSLFERRNPNEKIQKEEGELKDHVVLIGCGRLGSTLISLFKKKKVPLLVVDFNPYIVERVSNQGINTLFGDITDPDIVEAASLSKAKLIVSTVFDKEDNLEILEILKKRGDRIAKIVTAPTEKEALELYERGANYVIIPRILGGERIVELLLRSWKKDVNLERLKKSHFKELKERIGNN